MKKRTWVILIIILALLAAGGYWFVRTGRAAVVKARWFGLSASQVMRVEDEITTCAEASVFLASQRGLYETAYGKDVWTVTFDNGETFEDRLKESMREFLARLTAMQVLARRDKLSLSREETGLCAAAGREYYSRLSEAQRSSMGITEAVCIRACEKYRLAAKLCERLTAGESGEVSDGEARIIRIQQILSRDEDRIHEAYDRVTAAGADFSATAKRYSMNASKIDITAARGDLAPELEEAAFALTDGQISPIVQVGDVFYILRCSEDYDPRATQANKERILAKRRAQMFLDVYENARTRLNGELNDAAWDKLSFPADDGEYPSFYKVFRTYFP
ncbi:MAG: peptidyl-prolyl cis-trans isomerase [Lachnospiraceae bacterium]|nr:peptidyl-prolyl cis-trans isomerase [Lachnospiraceae bacterium]